MAIERAILENIEASKGKGDREQVNLGRTLLSILKEFKEDGFRDDDGHNGQVKAEADVPKIRLEDGNLEFKGRRLPVTFVEERLLRCLATQASHTATFSDLYLAGWGGETNRNAMRAAVNRLSRKLRGSDLSLGIYGIHNYGYVLKARANGSGK